MERKVVCLGKLAERNGSKSSILYTDIYMKDLFNSKQPGDDGVAIMKFYLDTNHEIVNTHSDLHAPNIMVTIIPQFSQKPVNTITGTCNLSDFQVTQAFATGICGWYPEYWEYVKALNTITIGGDSSDWWSYLPNKIGSGLRNIQSTCMIEPVERHHFARGTVLFQEGF